MSANMARYPLLKILHNYRYILIPALVFTIELTVWAVLNLKGVGDMGWVSWRVSLLLSVFLLYFSGTAFNKREDWYFMYGSVVPWGGMLIGAIVYGFIQMNVTISSVRHDEGSARQRA